MKILNKNVFFIYGMKRSGHHGVMNWIFKQTKGNLVHFNDCVLNLKPKNRMFDIYDNDYGMKKIKITDKKKYIDFINLSDTVVFSFENRYLDFINNNNAAEKLSKLNINGKNVKFIFINRDIFNNTASLYARKWKNINWNYFRKCWKDYARQYLENIRSGFIGISFNKWVEDIEYRKTICRKLSLEFTDSEFDETSPYGGGSSFDRMKMKYRKSSDMDLLERWKVFAEDEEYWNKIDSESIFLSLKMFGDITGREASFAKNKNIAIGQTLGRHDNIIG